MIPQKRKKGEIPSSPNTGITEPTNKKQTIDEDVQQEGLIDGTSVNGLDLTLLSSPSMTPPGSRETTPEAIIRTHEELHAQLLALRNGVVSRKYASGGIGDMRQQSTGSTESDDALDTCIPTQHLQNHRGSHLGDYAMRSEASRLQWKDVRHEISDGFFSEEDDLITSTKKAITIGENIVNGASATIQQVRDRVPLDYDGNSLHIEEVIQEQHAILQTLLRMGRPLVDTSIDVLEQNKLLHAMVISMKERETLWMKEKKEYQLALKSTVDWAPFDPLMADSNNFDDGGEAELPCEFTLSDDDGILPALAQWNSQRTGGAYTMKADYPYLRKFYPKLLGSPQPIPTDEEIVKIIKPYEGNPEMTLVKIKRYYNDVRMKREYKIRELIKKGLWEKLAKDWGIEMEEAPKTQ